MMAKVATPPYDPSRLMPSLAGGLFGLPRKIADPQIIAFTDSGEFCSQHTLDFIEYIRKKAIAREAVLLSCYGPNLGR